MPCVSPLKAWRTDAGAQTMVEPWRDPDKYTVMHLPCGGCIGCRQSRAREWAFRCHLELSQHDVACWATLTYADAPPSLSRQHLSAYLKRLRSRVGPSRVVRFFASGEYGELNGRPHYHAILFGLPRDAREITEAWGHGFVRVDPISPAAINYVAGYTSKKVGAGGATLEFRVDPSTGEEYVHQPPFLQMSRRPGIAGDSRKHWPSWRSFAVHNGRPIPVPRYLHEAWLAQTTPSDHEVLAREKSLYPRPIQDAAHRAAMRALLSSRHSLSSSKRRL